MGKTLLKLVNEMLDLSKLETGKMSLQLVNGDMINFLRYIVDPFIHWREPAQTAPFFIRILIAFMLLMILKRFARS
jgi:signal transduction histidine kinase